MAINHESLVEHTSLSKEVDLATMPIPDDARSEKKSLTMAWWGVCSALFYIYIAATLAINYGTINTIIGMVLSVVSYGYINSLLTRYAIKTGLSVSLFSRILFGKVGAVLATLIFFLTAIYYAVFEGSIIAVAASKVIPSVSYPWACVLVVIYSVPLVFGSVQNWLDKLNGFLLPFYLVGLVVIVVMTIATYGYDNAWLFYEPSGGAPSLGWLNVFIAYMGVWILMMFTFDFARFGRKSDNQYHAKFNFGMPFYIVTFLLNGLVGIYLTLAGGLAQISETGVVDQLIVVLGGGVALLFIWITQTRINTANYYLASVNMHAFFEQLLPIKSQKWQWALVVGILALILMLSTNVFQYILTALTYQGIFVTAWVGIAMSHILLNVSESEDLDRVPKYNLSGLLSWFISVGIGFIWAVLSLPGHEYSPIFTVVIAFIAYAQLTQKRISSSN